jgi:hypothetical protein
VHTAVVLPVQFLWYVREEAKIDVVGDEGSKWSQSTAEGVENLE